MRCAIQYDENSSLYKQNVHAWSELQSLKEEPAYREEDIMYDADKVFFEGYKYALDDIFTTLDNLVEGGGLEKDKAEEIRDMAMGGLCLNLFSILDHQDE